MYSLIVLLYYSSLFQLGAQTHSNIFPSFTILSDTTRDLLNNKLFYTIQFYKKIQNKLLRLKMNNFNSFFEDLPSLSLNNVSNRAHFSSTQAKAPTTLDSSARLPYVISYTTSCQRWPLKRWTDLSSALMPRSEMNFPIMQLHPLHLN